MQYLLDTHTLAWAVGEPERLSPHVQQLISDLGNTLFVSPVSVWEMSIKYRKGKWRQVVPFLHEDSYTLALAYLAATELPITSRHSRVAGGFTMSHQDPFDRLLAAQAHLENMPLLSTDTKLDAFPITRIWHSP